MVPRFHRPMQLLKGAVDRFRGLTLYVRDSFSAYRQRSYERGSWEVIVVRICTSSHYLYMFGVYRNPNLSDNIFHYLLTAMAKVQPVDKKAYLFVGDVNAHHDEWLNSSTTTVHSKVTLDFASSSGCEQMVTEPTHIDEGD